MTKQRQVYISQSLLLIMLLSGALLLWGVQGLGIMMLIIAFCIILGRTGL